MMQSIIQNYKLHIHSQRISDGARKMYPPPPPPPLPTTSKLYSYNNGLPIQSSFHYTFNQNMMGLYNTLNFAMIFE